MKILRILALACVMAAASAANVMAEGYAMYEWSARSVALGGATMARAPDPSVIAGNPAGLTGVKGTQAQIGLSVVKPYGKIKFDDQRLGPRAYEKDKLKDSQWFMPNMYFTYQVDERLSVGFGEYTRFGLGFEFDKNWVGASNIYEVNLTTASLAPTMAYKLTDNLSIGGSIEIMYLDINLKKNQPVVLPPIMGGANLGNMDIDVEGDNTSFGGSIGLHYTLNDHLAFGFSYRHFMRHNVKGKGKMSADNAVLDAYAPALGLIDQDVEASVTLPESVSFGTAIMPFDKLSIEAGAVWTRWSRFKNLDLNFEHRGLAPNPKVWNNTWRFNIGAEYALANWLDLRAGFVWDGCPVENIYEDYLIPTDGRYIYSLGTGLHLGDWTIDAAYAFVNPRERTYSYRRNDGVYNAKTYSSGTHIASLSVGYKF